MVVLSTNLHILHNAYFPKFSLTTLILINKQPDVYFNNDISGNYVAEFKVYMAYFKDMHSVEDSPTLATICKTAR